MPKQKLIPIFLTPAEIKNLVEILEQWTRQVDDHHAKTALVRLVTAIREKPLAQAQ